ncbi:hypothetical protein DL96DRAFT_1622232 [Flagelloscypha sp. PMI_526]|nr:hypothetical protein DL96DRAFT_1622232 [Flagelloscypha sp. PMI_526]
MTSCPYHCLAISSIWTTFSSRLRELAISVSYPTALAHILPARTQPLPRLEVMRLGYLYRLWDTLPSGVVQSDLMLERLAQLYTNQSLQVLEMKLLYPCSSFHNGGLFLAEKLLPKRHIYPQLRRFWIATECVDNINSSQTSHISSFIRAHARTLRGVAVHNFPAVIRDLFVNTPDFSLQPSLSIAFVVPQTAAVTKTLVELQMPFGYDISPRHNLPCLRRLTIGIEDLRLESFDHLARKVPQLLSLSVSYSNVSCTHSDISRRIAIAPASILSQWNLKDLTLYPEAGIVPIAPNYSLMRDIARLVPSIESFVGSGDMSEKREDWEAVWPWSRNVYIDPLLDGY